MFKRITSCSVAAFIAAAILIGQGAIQAPQVPQAQARIPTHIRVSSVVHTGYASASSDFALKAKKKTTTIGCKAGATIGAICKDGTRSYTTGRGACSYQKGVKSLLLCKK